MGKIQVTSTASIISASMGQYFSADPKVSSIKRGAWRKEKISFLDEGDHVRVNIEGEKSWFVSNIEDINNKVLKIDNVNGENVSSVEDLFNKLELILS